VNPELKSRNPPFAVRGLHGSINAPKAHPFLSPGQTPRGLGPLKSRRALKGRNALTPTQGPGLSKRIPPLQGGVILVCLPALGIALG